MTRRATFVPVEDGTPDVDYASLGLAPPSRVSFLALLRVRGVVRGVAYGLLFEAVVVAGVFTVMWVASLR